MKRNCECALNVTGNEYCIIGCPNRPKRQAKTVIDWQTVADELYSIYGTKYYNTFEFEILKQLVEKQIK